ncbi:Cro/C1-type HTH DNA-binding domain-containing protein [Pilibacter termitis]|uniref:Cro/C1-type HTH DNA-binding domain-containing protein n=1 Tax=Pilibacter termitis TaxID=263852 RepID=A0A1T4KHK6_9ENTE|nr:helix-turn-helix domain-containing protein [Pilibacter termitis]SJZ41856.1 Cro/C1-type HTH DNA-binding domain-containing protein [Pilibacter termitis]
MKSILDIFLKEHGKTRYEVAKNSGVLETTLSKANRRDPETYTVKTISGIAKAVNKTPGEVLDRLIEIKESDELYVVTTFSELKQRVKEQEDEFVIKGDLHGLIRELERERLSETVELGFQIGTRGLGATQMWIITRIVNLFEDVSNREREIMKQDISTLYRTEFIDETTAKLRLKQLGY